ncbi:MFS transporter [Xylophilus sp.]|uniref:MFS transporter n=1 Tax=Xylophilus sp. TaxID=2653893 RepID=UPI002D801A2A|nr:MFS transporter [Xylophilus sp.]
MTTTAPADPATLSSLLRQHSFMRFWLTRLAGTAGNQILMVAVGWQMYDLTGRAWDLGLVGLYQFVPALLLTLVAGQVADRLHRGRIVAACMVLQGLVALILVLATEGHWAGRWLLLAVSVLLGVARAFQMPAQQALLPLLVAPAQLPRAMAFSSGALEIAVIGGPALGGLIFVAGATAVYATCVALFALASMLAMRMRYEHVPPPPEPVSVQTMLAGVGFIWDRKVVLGAIALDLFAVLLGGAVALLPIYAKDILHTGPWGLGLLRAAPAVGALVMSVVLARWPLERRVGGRMLWAVALFGVATVVFGFSQSLALSILALAVTGAADMVSVVVRQTLVQLQTPDAMRGRVSAVSSIFIGASNQLGEFRAGSMAALIGPVGAVVGTVLVALGWVRLFPALARYDRIQ